MEILCTGSAMLHRFSHNRMSGFMEGNRFFLLGFITRFFFSGRPPHPVVAPRRNRPTYLFLIFPSASKAPSLTHVARSAPTNPGCEACDLSEIHIGT